MDRAADRISIMNPMRFLYVDKVKVYSAPQGTFTAAITSGTSTVYEQILGALLPLSNEEAMTAAGGFDRTRVRFLTAPEYLLEAGQHIEVIESGCYAVGDRFVIEGESQKYPNPLDPRQAHHQEAILVKEQN